MDTANDQSKEKRLERMVTTEQMSPSFVAACSTRMEKELINQEMEYLSDDCDSPGNSYEIYLGKVSRNPIVMPFSKASLIITDHGRAKYFPVILLTPASRGEGFLNGRNDGQAFCPFLTHERT
jgi:hypothetical protein